MTYGKFATFNIVGAVAWVTSFLMLGFFFGGLPVIKNNFTYVIFGIIFVSILPPIIEVIREKRKPKAEGVTKG
jgi:membrane-associated protein